MKGIDEALDANDKERFIALSSNVERHEDSEGTDDSIYFDGVIY